MPNHPQPPERRRLDLSGNHTFNPERATHGRGGETTPESENEYPSNIPWNWPEQYIKEHDPLVILDPTKEGFRYEQKRISIETATSHYSEQPKTNLVTITTTDQHAPWTQVDGTSIQQKVDNKNNTKFYHCEVGTDGTIVTIIYTTGIPTGFRVFKPDGTVQEISAHQAINQLNTILLPDGTIVFKGEQITKIFPDGSTTQISHTPHEVPRISREGTLFTVSAGQIRLYTGPNTIQEIYHPQITVDSYVSLSADGQQVAFTISGASTGKRELIISNTKGNATKIEARNTVFGRIIYAPDGTLYAEDVLSGFITTITPDLQIQHLDTGTSKPLSLSEKAFTTNGTLLVTTGNTSGKQLITRIPSGETYALHFPFDTDGFSGEPFIGQDGSIIACPTSQNGVFRCPQNTLEDIQKHTPNRTPPAISRRHF